MTYEVSIDIDVKVGIDGDDGDDSKYGIDKFVENNHTADATSTDTNASTVNNNETSNPSLNGTPKSEDNSVNGIDGDDGDDSGIDEEKLVNSNDEKDETARPLDPSVDNEIDGIDNSVDNNNGQEIAESETYTGSNHALSVQAKDTNFENDITDQSITNTNTNTINQISRAMADGSTSINDISSHTKDLSHLSQQPTTNLTREIIAEFFYDDGLPYRPPSPHTLDESPCKSIIRMDEHSF